MNIQSLRTFYLAGRYESMTAAADALTYAQSTVTTHIKQLEAEWGVKLFKKAGRGVRLTPEGRTIHNKVATIVHQLDMLDAVVNGITSGGAGHLRIGVMEPVGSYRVIPVLAKLTRNRPLVQINLETGSIYSLGQRLHDGELELVVAHQPPHWSGNKFSFDPLFQEKQRVLMPADHPLAQKDVLEIDDLRDQRLLYQDTISAYDSLGILGFSFHGGQHRFANIELNSITAIITAVQHGLGVAFLPDYCLEPVPENCAVRQVRGYDFERTIGILFPARALDPLMQEVVQALQTTLKR